jgi:hypothetical protein
VVDSFDAPANTIDRRRQTRLNRHHGGLAGCAIVARACPNEKPHDSTVIGHPVAIVVKLAFSLFGNQVRLPLGG